MCVCLRIYPSPLLILFSRTLYLLQGEQGQPWAVSQDKHYDIDCHPPCSHTPTPDPSTVHKQAGYI